MDEVGRGTTVKDGIAIAFATVHHLYSANAYRALFATHFHEVADILGYSEDDCISTTFPNIRFFCSDVDKTKVRGLIKYIYGSKQLWRRMDILLTLINFVVESIVIVMGLR